MPTPGPLQPGESLKEQIVRLIRQQIEAGELRDGEALPTSRALAERWGVSVFTISEAMKILATLGYVENHPNSRRVIRDPHATRPARLHTLTPTVVLVGGYAGSGKTEFGRVLARRTGWPIIDKDTITRPVVEFALSTLNLPEHDRESSHYSDLVRPREYEALMETAIENVQCGLSVVVTAPFLREFTSKTWLDRAVARFDSHGARIAFVWVNCDIPTMRTYLRARGAARDASKLDNWDTYAASVDVDLALVTNHLVVENGANAEPLQPQADRLVQVLADAQSVPR